ncbi:MAG: RagB/SusD family nutrient uptake outer membrane protein, partial [Bacteroidales bacterium]
WEGILRVNLIIKRFDQAEFDNEEDRNQALGEAHFLRAFFYFRLSKFFGPVPLKLDPAPANLPRATAEEMYGQIALDLKTAIELMKRERFGQISADRLGHATLWAAEALMGRVFLFYTGYYNQSSLPLADGGQVTQQEVVNWLDDCIQSSGHELLDDPRNNWTYANVNVNYPYAADNGLVWADGWIHPASNIVLNRETVWAIKYSIYGGWSPTEGEELSYSNQNVLYSGLRQQSYVPFGQGWGAGPVIEQLWDSFEEGDVRREGSILNVIEPTVDEGPVADNYIWGSDNQVEETGYWCKKYLPIYDSLPETDRIVSIFYIEYEARDDMQLWNMQDDILIRFADVMLMAAELGSSNAQNYVDQIRDRAGLASVPVSLDVIKAERRHEFVGEGIRYFDILRWHDVEAAFAEATNFDVQNSGEPGTYVASYRPETGGFLPLPETEILLSDGVLEQTPGWD